MMMGIVLKNAFKKGRKSISANTSALKQHMPRAVLHSTRRGALGRTTNAGGESAPTWARHVSICIQNKSNTFALLSFPSFFPLLPPFFLPVPSCSCNLQIQTPKVSQNASFSAGTLFVFGPVPKCRDVFGFLGTDFLKLQITLSSKKVTFLVLCKPTALL